MSLFVSLSFAFMAATIALLTSSILLIVYSSKLEAKCLSALYCSRWEKNFQSLEEDNLGGYFSKKCGILIGMNQG